MYRRFPGGIAVRDDADKVAEFDGVVIATHADDALRLLADPTDEEQAVLGAFAYTRNEVVLHTDDSVLPRSRHARASWNYLLPACSPSAEGVRVSYDMNRLQRLDAPIPYVVSLNDNGRISSNHILDRMVYKHPVYSPAVLRAQQRLPALSSGPTTYAGAYHGWGFHEDGCRSGVEAARVLGVKW